MRRTPEAAPLGRRAAPGWARPFVAALLTTLCICAVLGIEAWPFTGWQLFSRTRPERVLGYEIVAVDATGTERVVPFDRMPYAYRGYAQILPELERLPPTARRAVCAAWREGATRILGPLDGLRIYQTERRLSQRDGSRGLPPRRTLVGECD